MAHDERVACGSLLPSSGRGVGIVRWSCPDIVHAKKCFFRNDLGALGTHRGEFCTEQWSRFAMLLLMFFLSVPFRSPFERCVVAGEHGSTYRTCSVEGMLVRDSFVTERKRSWSFRHLYWCDTMVRRSSTGPVPWLALTHRHDASILKPIENKKNKKQQNRQSGPIVQDRCAHNSLLNDAPLVDITIGKDIVDFVSYTTKTDLWSTQALGAGSGFEGLPLERASVDSRKVSSQRHGERFTHRHSPCGSPTVEASVLTRGCFHEVQNTVRDAQEEKRSVAASSEAISLFLLWSISLFLRISRIRIFVPERGAAEKRS